MEISSNRFKWLLESPARWQTLLDEKRYLIQKMTQKERINICLVGAAGSGKSSLINTLLSTFSDSPRLDAAVHESRGIPRERQVKSSWSRYLFRARDDEPDDYFIRTFQEYFLPGTNVHLIESIGIKRETNGTLTYNGQVEHLLKGQFREGTTHEMLMNAQEEKIAELGLDEMNHVVLVLRAMNENQSDEVFEQITKARLMMREPPPIVGVVTKLDSGSSNGPDFNINQLHRDTGVVEKFREITSTVLRGQLSFPVQTEAMAGPHFEDVTHLLTLELLEQAVRDAKQFKTQIKNLRFPEAEEKVDKIAALRMFKGMQSFETSASEQELIDMCVLKRNRLQEMTENNIVNICVIGRTGAGKSAFVNTALSAFSPEFGPRIDAAVGEEVNQATCWFQEYELPGSKIRLIDSIGMQIESLMDGRITYDGVYTDLLQGRFRPQTNLEAVKKIGQGEGEKPQFDVTTLDFDSEINHGVLFVHAIDSENDIFVRVFDKIQQARLEMEYAIPLFGVVTKVDLASTEDHFEIAQLFDDVDIAVEFRRVRRLLRVESFPVRCYNMDISHQNPAINLLVLNVLERVVAQAIHYKQRMISSHFVDEDKTDLGEKFERGRQPLTRRNVW